MYPCNQVRRPCMKSYEHEKWPQIEGPKGLVPRPHDGGPPAGRMSDLLSHQTIQAPKDRHPTHLATPSRRQV